MNLDRIKSDKDLKKKFIEAFYECAEDCNEIIIGDPIEQIFNCFETQGYWSGVRYNISFDMDLGFEYEQRRFG
jgi:hypothetical protein